MNIVYSPRKVDLFYPARSGNFFSSGLPETEAALCAEVRLAYCRSEPNFQFDQQQVRAVLEPLGCMCQFFENTGTPNGMGSHGLLAVHEDSESSKSLAVLAFRGTDADDPTDLADDAEFLQCNWPLDPQSPIAGLVDTGFAGAIGPLLPTLSPALDKLRGRVLFTGHSLGAAMATLLASIRRPDFLNTFGSPRVGDAQFVSTLNGMSNRRFVDCCDVVARIPPESLGKINYEHYGVPFYIDRGRRITENPANSAVEEDRITAASEYLVEYAWRKGNLAVRELGRSRSYHVTAVATDASQPKLTRWKVTAKAASSS